jgi:acetyl esterase
VVSLLARDGREPSPAAQLLVYPATDALREWPSYALFGEGFFLSNVDRTTFSGHYLEGTGVERGDPRVSPLLADDLSRLPPALVVTAGYDVLRDEGEAYAEALRAAGTPVRLLRIPGHGHGFLHMTGVSPSARAAVVQLARDWREVLERSQSGASARAGE